MRFVCALLLLVGGFAGGACGTVEASSPDGMAGGGGQAGGSGQGGAADTGGASGSTVSDAGGHGVGGGAGAAGNGGGAGGGAGAASTPPMCDTSGINRPVGVSTNGCAGLVYVLPDGKRLECATCPTSNGEAQGCLVAETSSHPAARCGCGGCVAP